MDKPNFAALTPVSQGDDLLSVITAQRINAIQNAILWLKNGGNLRRGHNTRIRYGPAGIIISAQPKGEGGGAATVTHPFQIYLSGGDTLLRPGHVNGLVPINIFAPLTLTGTGTEYAVLRASCTAQTVSSSSIIVGTPQGIGSAPSIAPTTFDVVLAVWVDGVGFQVVYDNLSAAVTETIREDKASPTPGTLTYIPYYTWVIT